MIIGAVVTLVGVAISMLWAPGTRNRTFADAPRFTSDGLNPLCNTRIEPKPG